MLNVKHFGVECSDLTVAYNCDESSQCDWFIFTCSMTVCNNCRLNSLQILFKTLLNEIPACQ